MRRNLLILSIVTVLLFLVSCSPADETIGEENPKPVRVIEVNEETIQVKLNYIGMVQSDQIKKIAFKSPGKIAGINVSEGQSIKKGDVLAILDTTDLEFGLKASKAQMDAAEAQYKKAVNGASKEDVNKAELNLNKAKAAYDFAKQSYEDVENLYKNEAVSKIDLDRTKLELDIREAEYNQAEQVYKQVVNGARQEDKNMLSSQLEQAKTDYLHKKNLLDEATLKTDIDGYVVDVLYKEGEMISAGYPMIVIRKEGKAVKVGLTQKDYGKVKIGTKAIVKVDGTDAEGSITSIEQVPDMQTRTYSVDISLPENNFQIGSIAKVEFIIGEEKAVRVPITAIISSQEDYVFTLNEENVLKKSVQLGETIGTTVIVKGINSGDRLVVEGMKRLFDGDKVTVVQ